ncbi:LbetaH domain-containing protein [Zobellia barbeyronii]|uniref:Serine acetyltransferase n=1 Tax=Zobellia barbeyronii TaxID=2748009 RepID=A0ABS5WJI4_9FLAO|nr:serine acetyltransferase [Zobellia barbeyronii]MBT2163551.1 serine acetyltransferase [Zobellia barbeyronii]
MITSKKQLSFYIAADRIISGSTPKKSIKERLQNIVSPNDILKYLKAMRTVAYCVNSKKKKTFLYYYNLRVFNKLGAKLGFSIGYNVFGYGLLIPHYGTIVINSGTSAGNFCVLHTSTCIGGSGKRIGNGLYLASGAQIMGGNVELGNNVSISASSMVNKSFKESNILLAGLPATLRKESLPWYKRDGETYETRIERIKELRKELNLN